MPDFDQWNALFLCFALGLCAGIGIGWLLSKVIEDKERGTLERKLGAAEELLATLLRAQSPPDRPDAVKKRKTMWD